MRRIKDYFPTMPKRCPKMDICEKGVDLSEYAACNSEMWIYCEKNEKELEKYLRKPREWKLIEKLEGEECQRK